MNTSTYGDNLAGRTTSGFPISIGTSLAFESLFNATQQPYDPQRKIPNKINVQDYQEIWINLTSMYRNIVGAITRDAFFNASEVDFKDALNEEIEIINGLFLNEGNGLCKPHYYYCTYHDLLSHTNKAVKFRQDNTEFQKFFRAKLEASLKLLYKETDAHFKFDTAIKPTSKQNSLIFTHIPYDLLSYKHFNSLALLEGHTGKLKTRREWNSKYYPIPNVDLSNMPFNRMLMLVFGDKVQIMPTEMKLRKLLVDIAKNRGWNSTTTRDKIMLDIEIDIKEPYVIQFLRSL